MIILYDCIFLNENNSVYFFLQLRISLFKRTNRICAVSSFALACLPTMPQILFRFSLRIFQLLIFVLFFSLKKLTLVKSKKTAAEATSLDILTNRERGGTAEGTPVGVVKRAFARDILCDKERGGTAEGNPVGVVNRGFAQDILN
jgi:hypothetical protein